MSSVNFLGFTITEKDI